MGKCERGGVESGGNWWLVLEWRVLFMHACIECWVDRMAAGAMEGGNELLERSVLNVGCWNGVYVVAESVL